MRFLQSYFTWSIARIDERAADLKQERNDILSSVKETETYKVCSTSLMSFDDDITMQDAMEILQRFDPTERRRKWEAEERARQEEERRRARSRERELAAEAARHREAQSEQLRRRRTMIPADVQRQPSPGECLSHVEGHLDLTQLQLNVCRFRRKCLQSCFNNRLHEQRRSLSCQLALNLYTVRSKTCDKGACRCNRH